MKLNKILAVVAAAAMAATLSLPVFAEATPGQIANESSQKVVNLLNKETWTEEDKETATNCIKEYVAAATDSANSNVVTANMAYSAIGTYNKLGDEAFSNAERELDGVTVTFHGDKEQPEDITLKRLEIDEDTVTIEAEATKSDMGYVVEIPVAGVPDGTQFVVADSDSGVTYVKEDNGKEDNTFTVHDGKLVFYVLHFTTYTLKKVSTVSADSTTTPSATAAPAAATSKDSIQYYTCKACGYHDWTATEEGYRCDNCGYIESQKQLAGYGNVKGVYSPETGTENPIKATGSDMSPMIFAVVALAVAATCGMGVASKKSRKSE